MLFNSPIFLFGFLPLTALLCFVIRAYMGREASLGFLVLASLFFYGWWNPIYLPLLIGLAIFNFLMAQAILNERLKPGGGAATFLTAFGVTVDLGALGFFKYTDFLIGTSNAVLETDFPLQHIVLPLAISFFTFQKIAYLVDARRGDVEPHSFLEYCFFVMFFPQLIAGPIVHHKEIFSQTKQTRGFAFDRMNVTIGLTIFFIGLFKKVVLADNAAPVATAVFNSAAAGNDIGFFDAWEGMLAYTFQLYFDFSGYSDMAIGAARIFGIKLPLNFHSPYQALSITDFWRRWHMTLSRFLRDYLYIALGGNRHGKVRRYLNLFITMALGGLWHGPAWTFMLWGAAHGLMLIVNHGWNALPRKPINTWWSRGIARALTFLCVALAWVLFRAVDIDAATAIYRGLVALPLDNFSPHRLIEDIAWLVFWMGIVWFWPNTQQWLAMVRPAFNYKWADRRRDPLLLPVDGTRFARLALWRPSKRVAVAVGLAAAASLLSLQRISEFLYFQF
ncbi:MAG: MBOAT family O-acyltransferase [Parvibaculum sp.]|uniref:MBOAT family O-acyltransferase n=1 Tax=Parvibaculum sp. TaxID=2024848 RepID=UPI0027300C48|nr:MBOAT family O-acyltransferase [Parvibaculum sp.]MDP1628075.1 MBOAT family O-acyltransferase [Parvibaculum sp.]MDP2151074.1 MBOAT family O-acyltransferase [Parvibaculum sp.]MDP3328541.1 MBOAT family O-acyltransferase [Parvibaculum sp.]